MLYSVCTCTSQITYFLSALFLLGVGGGGISRLGMGGGVSRLGVGGGISRLGVGGGISRLVLCSCSCTCTHVRTCYISSLGVNM